MDGEMFSFFLQTTYDENLWSCLPLCDIEFRIVGLEAEFMYFIINEDVGRNNIIKNRHLWVGENNDIGI